MRVQRALAHAGLASRREAEEWIRAGRVKVDGRVVKLGDKVDPEHQRITVGRREVRAQTRRWLAFHKPLGVVTTKRDEKGRRTVFDYLPEPQGLRYVGRLDVNTTGLLLMTTDGDAVHRLTHPKYAVPRQYSILVHGKSTAELRNLVRRKYVIDGRPLAVQQATVKPGRDGRSVVNVTLSEGRNRIVRKWCEAMGVKVQRLGRVAYGPVRLGDLAPGEYRPLTPAEERKIYRAVDLEPSGS